MKYSLPLLVALAAVSSPAYAAGILSSYINFNSYEIPTLEASAVAYSPATDSLYIIGDEGQWLTEYSKSGQTQSSTAIGGFSDTEAVAYMGTNASGQPLFMVGDERIQHASLITYNQASSPNSETHANFTQGYSFGEKVGNIGLEGLSYDPLTNSVWGVKETGPEAIYQMSLDTAGKGTSLAVDSFNPATLGLNDLSDIYVMAACAAFAGTDREWNLLILSQESKMLLEVTRTGQIVDSLDLASLGLEKDDTIEGVTMDNDGTLYLVGEGGSKSLGSHLYALTSTTVPETSSAILGMIGTLAMWRRRR